MDAIDVIQASLGTLSLLALACSGWLFYKALETGRQGEEYGARGLSTTVQFIKRRARYALLLLWVGLGVGFISIWLKGIVATLRG